jgi:protease PrsW
MPFISSLLAAIIPMFIYLIFIWRLDRYEREPFGKVFKHFLWGAIGAVFFGIIISNFLNSTAELLISSEDSIIFISAVIVAPFAEELVKALYLFRSFRKNYFDNITDGLVYGGAIGLGFGMTENLMYFTTYDDTLSQWISIVITRSIFSAVMHAIATATVGAFLAKAKFSLSSSKYLYPIIGISLAMFFHATWNFSLTFEFTYYLGLLFMIFLIFCFFFIFNSSLKTERIMITNELSEENDILVHNLNQNNVKDSIFVESKKFQKRSQRKAYVNFATKLAFRKFQARNSDGLQKDRYISDIELYRQKILDLSKQIES